MSHDVNMVKKYFVSPRKMLFYCGYVCLLVLLKVLRGCEFLCVKESVGECELLFFVCSMNTLAEMFELERPVVHSIISKMIINGELQVLEKG